jgi:hypothetical protein
MPPQDRTPLGDAMTHRFPEQKIPEPTPNATMTEVPSPDPVPPLENPEDKPNQKRDDGDKPQAPPADDEPGRRYIPIDLPGREHAPERV